MGQDDRSWGSLRGRPRTPHTAAPLAGGDAVALLEGVLQDWARELGLEPETLYRALAELESAGEVVREARGVRLAGNGTAPVRSAGWGR